MMYCDIILLRKVVIVYYFVSVFIVIIWNILYLYFDFDCKYFLYWDYDLVNI